jgi:hypothetical protein
MFMDVRFCAAAVLHGYATNRRLLPSQFSDPLPHGTLTNAPLRRAIKC